MGSTESAEVVDQILAVNKSCSSFYRMLAHVYMHELTQEQIEHLATLDFSEMAADDELVASGYESMRRFLSRLNSGTRQSLAVDYAHTFLAAGNYETFAATPYESVFTSELGLMMQEARDEVYKMYCAEHIQPDEALHMPEDHISFEFEFMAVMLERMNEALESGDFPRALECAEVAKEFHAQHQLNWVDDLCDAIMDVARTEFYRGISQLTRGFVHLETEVIDDEVHLMRELLQEQAG